MPKRNPIKRPLPPYLTSSDMVNIRAAIKAGEKRMQAAINSLEQRQTNNERQFGAHVTFMCARYDEARAMAERLDKLERDNASALDCIGMINATNAAILSRLAVLEKNAETPPVAPTETPGGLVLRDSTDVPLGGGRTLRIRSYGLRKPCRWLTRLYRRAVAWVKSGENWGEGFIDKVRSLKSLKCNNPECAKCYPPSDYNAEHPMTKGGDAKPRFHRVCNVDDCYNAPMPGDDFCKEHGEKPDATQHCGKTPCENAQYMNLGYDSNCAACRAANGEGK